MYYVLLAVPAAILLFLMFAYWQALYRMGYLDQVIEKVPTQLPTDAATALLILFVFNFGVHASSGHSLLMEIDTSPAQTRVAAFLTLMGALLLARFNAWDRFTTPTLVGMREAAVASLIALSIIERGEDIARKDRANRRLK